MPQFRTSKKQTVQEEQQNGATAVRTPSAQALEVVDVTFGAVPRVAGIVRENVTKLRDPSEREVLRKRLNVELEKAKAEGQPRRRKATEQFVEQTRKARQRVGV